VTGKGRTKLVIDRGSSKKLRTWGGQEKRKGKKAFMGGIVPPGLKGAQQEKRRSPAKKNISRKRLRGIAKQNSMSTPPGGVALVSGCAVVGGGGGGLGVSKATVTKGGDEFYRCRLGGEEDRVVGGCNGQKLAEETQCEDTTREVRKWEC